VVGLVRDEDRAEWLLDTGEVVCRSRRGFERVYDLAERAIPSSLIRWSSTTRPAHANWSNRPAAHGDRDGGGPCGVPGMELVRFAA